MTGFPFTSQTPRDNDHWIYFDFGDDNGICARGLTYYAYTHCHMLWANVPTLTTLTSSQ